MTSLTLTSPLKPASSEPSATQTAYFALRKMILTGELRPAEKLKIDGLRKVLDMGASPVREALSLLVSDQLVERLDQRGFRTAPVSAANFREILNLRCVLESQALEQSIPLGGNDWEDALVLAHHHLTRADRSDLESFEEQHKAFHMALLTAAESPILLKFCSQLYDLNIRYRFLAGRSGGYSARDVAGEHAEILDAAVARDVGRTRDVLIHHYRQTGEFLAEQFADT